MKKTLFAALLLTANLLPGQNLIQAIKGSHTIFTPADMDNDGFMDIAAEFRGPLWMRNSGDTAFSWTQSNIWWFPEYFAFSLADSDGDSDLDMLYSSQTSGGWNTRIFNTHANGISTNGANLSLPFNFYGGIQKWADFDQDGDLDVFGSGYNGQNHLMGLWEFENGLFSPSPSTFEQITPGVFTFFDLENDGDLDIVCAGQKPFPSYQNVVEIYRNDNSVFQKLANSGILGIPNPILQSADLNHDGRADLILAGNTDSWPQDPKAAVLIYYNLGNGTFTLKQSVEVPPGVNPGILGQILVADIDNNGIRDLVMSNPNLTIMQGAGGLWQVQDNQQFIPSSAGYVRLADFDHDQKLDFCVSNRDWSNPDPYAQVIEVYANPFPNAAKRPEPPKNITFQEQNGTVKFQWDAGSDDHTPPSSLRYNVRIGTAPGLGDIVSCDSDTSGRRLLFSDGNVPSGKKFTIKNLLGGNYWFSVQTLDGHLAGSTFASIPFTVGLTLAAPNIFYPQNGATDLPVFSKAEWAYVQNATSYEVQIATDLLFQNLVYQKVLPGNSDTLVFPDCDSIYYWRVRGLAAGYESTWSTIFSARTIEAFTWGAWGIDLPSGFAPSQVKFVHLDDDKRPDFVFFGSSNGTWQVFTFLGKPGGQFDLAWQSEAFGGILAEIGQTPLSLVDRDQDGDLDFYLAGMGANTTLFYKNTGNGQFEKTPAFEIPEARGEVAWFDADNDNDPDAVLPQSCETLLLLPDGPNSGGFQTKELNFCTVGGACVETFDFDNDGLQDIFTTGKVVYLALAKNAGNLNFPIVNTGDFDWAQNGDSETADFDGDGDLDLVVAGFNHDWQVWIYENTNGYFQLRQNLTSAWFTAISMLDFDLDGDPDLVLDGYQNPGLPTYKAQVFKNSGGQFEPFLTLPYPCGSLDKADIDGDGDQDLACGGVFLRNNEGRNLETPPDQFLSGPPEMLTSTVAGNSAILGFQADQNRGLNSRSTSFNLRVGTSPGGSNVVSPLADLTTGKNFIAKNGNAGTTGSFQLKGLPNGTYYWSVQSISPDLVASPFSGEQVFAVGPVPVFENVFPGNVRVFPNPAAAEIFVELPDGSDAGLLRVLDGFGKTVLETAVPAGGSGLQRVDIQSLASGVYFLQVFSGGAVFGAGLFLKI